jgi:hypothetical protein
MDNATNNDTLALGIERRSKEAGYYFSAMDSRMRCMPHTVHLAAIKVCVYFSYTHTLMNVCTIASRRYRRYLEGCQQEGKIP